jgi:hypothetical protein
MTAARCENAGARQARVARLVAEYGLDVPGIKALAAQFLARLK